MRRFPCLRPAGLCAGGGLRPAMKPATFTSVPKSAALSPAVIGAPKSTTGCMGSTWDTTSTRTGPLDLNLNTVRLKDEFDPGHLRLIAASLDVLRVFNREGVFAPYIAAGGGVLHYDTPFDAPSRDDFIAGSRRRRVYQALGKQQRLEQLLAEAGHPGPLGR